jgi:hypothetical protein
MLSSPLEPAAGEHCGTTALPQREWAILKGIRHSLQLFFLSLKIDCVGKNTHDSARPSALETGQFGADPWVALYTWLVSLATDAASRVMAPAAMW